MNDWIVSIALAFVIISAFLYSLQTISVAYGGWTIFIDYNAYGEGIFDLIISIGTILSIPILIKRYVL